MKTIQLIGAALLASCLSFGATTAKGSDDPIKKQTSTTITANQNKKAYTEDPGFRNAIGLRFGGTSGLTLKHRFTSGNAVEGIVGFWPDAFSLTGLYEKYVPAGPSGLNWYFGGGAHVGVATERTVYVWDGYRRSAYKPVNGDLGLGIDGMAGIEYKTPRAPFAFSFDFKPFVQMNTSGYTTLGLDPALGVKVAF